MVEGWGRQLASWSAQLAVEGVKGELDATLEGAVGGPWETSNPSRPAFVRLFG